jgi:hypothetical protein
MRISGINAGYTMFRDNMKGTPFASFPFTSRHLRHRVPSSYNWTLLTNIEACVNQRRTAVGIQETEQH